MTQPVLAGFPNSRDLGGLPTRHGTVTGHGAVIRADTPSDVDTDAVREAQRFGFGRIVDLRTESEVARAPHPLRDSSAYRHLPLIDPAADHARDPDSESGLGDVYQGSVERNTATIGAILQSVADAPAGPVLICCAAGKDRTGMISAMLLELAGASREAIGADYARTSSETESEDILQMLEHIDATHGSMQTYLRTLGITEAQLARLGELLQG